MMDSLITRCPTCGTSFKLTGIQLGAAGGAVRCGACLEVFSASEYILNPYPAELGPEDEPFTSTENDVDEQSVTMEAESGLIESGDIPDSGTSKDETEIDEFHEDDEDLQDLQIGTNIVYHLADNTELARSSADSPHQPLTENYEIETDIEPLDEASRISLNETIGTDPIEIIEVDEIVPTRKNVPKMVFLACVNLFLIAALTGQFLWFNRDSLAIREDLREYYLDLCVYVERAVNCSLPDYVNLKQISTRRLIVRSHPNISNALEIDAVILNSGMFAQPFPGLELKFADLEFNTVASRRFAASEYLDGELTGLGYMPGGTEVRLSLEIMDPGKDAISYELYAVRAPTAGQ